MKRAASMNRVEGDGPIEEETDVMPVSKRGRRLWCDSEILIEEKGRSWVVYIGCIILKK